MHTKFYREIMVEGQKPLLTEDPNFNIEEPEEIDMLPILNPIVSKHYAAQKAGILARQIKARAANKRAKQARKLNRK